MLIRSSIKHFNYFIDLKQQQAIRSRIIHEIRLIVRFKTALFLSSKTNSFGKALSFDLIVIKSAIYVLDVGCQISPNTFYCELMDSTDTSCNYVQEAHFNSTSFNVSRTAKMIGSVIVAQLVVTGYQRSVLQCSWPL